MTVERLRQMRFQPVEHLLLALGFSRTDFQIHVAYVTGGGAAR